MKCVVLHSLCFSGLLLCASVMANTGSDFRSAQAFIASQNLASSLQSSITNAHTLLPSGASHPDQEKYYRHPETIGSDAKSNVQTSNSIGNLEATDALNRPKVAMDKNTPEIEASRKIQNNADESTRSENIYCSDGSCKDTLHEKNKEFGKSVTEVAAASSAATDVQKQGENTHRNPNSMRIFSGRSVQCREIVLGALNCCADRGWANGLFAHCNAAEKALGHAKEQGGLVVKVGRYCRHHILGVCSEHKQTYCIFPSRIGYDVQVSGRRQLSMGYGSPKWPDCSGFTANQIGRINFDRVDFSNAVDSVKGKANIPNNSQSVNSLRDRFKKEVVRGQQNG